MCTHMVPGFRLACLFLFGATAAFSSIACNRVDDTDSKRVTQIQVLEDENARLRRQLIAQDEAIQGQAARIQALQDLQGERAIERLVHVSRVEMEALSGGYDDDHDGIDEGIVVYLRLLDQDGDTIKAAGAVHVQLLDLANPPTSQLVGEVRLNADELRPMWFGRFLTAHYTVKIPWAGGARRAAHKSITVLVRFTDLLSGQSFSAQTVIEVSGAGTGPGTETGTGTRTGTEPGAS